MMILSQIIGARAGFGEDLLGLLFQKASGAKTGSKVIGIEGNQKYAAESRNACAATSFKE